MLNNCRHTVPYGEHPRVETLPGVNWEDIRVFLAVAQSNSFRRAALALGLSFNTVRRHIDRLESTSGMVLFARHSNGIEITNDGRALLDSAREMERAAVGIRRRSQKSGRNLKGRVRITITEGLGTFWIIPRLTEFQRSHPHLVLEVNCSFREPDLTRMEADIAIQFSKPTHAELKITKLGRLHIMPFASPEYLRTFGIPTSLHDVENHKIVEQLSPQLDVTAVDRLFPDKQREGFVSVVTNTSTAHFQSVARGAGLGMLPTYLTALGARIQPVDLDFKLSHDIWLSYHADSKRLRRVAATINWLRDTFEPKLFPWFSDEFVHPTEFAVTDARLVDSNHLSGLIYS